MQLNSVFKDWLNNRKISDKVLEDFGIYGEEEIVIPVHDIDGTFVFNKYRRSPLSDEKPKYWYDRGGKVTLYGYHYFIDKQIDSNSKVVLITEGEMDCLVAVSQNIPAVTSTGGAMSFQKEWEGLFLGIQPILCFDNDHAGAEGMVKALAIIPHAKVMFIPDRPGIKDISDYVAGGGDLQTLIKTAKHFKDIADVKEDMQNRIANFQSVYFHEAYIKAHTKVNTHYERKTFSNDRITNAKLYPIPNLLEFNQNKALCPFHNEKSASLHYYSKTNSCYCFGCGKPYDAIAIYMKKFGVGFKEAVDELNRLV